MSYVIEGDNVYYEDDRIKSHVGMVSKTEIGVRIDNNTVADVSYQFDLTLGEYVETGRVTRAEPLPPVPPTMEDQVNQLKSRQADILFAMVDKDLI